MLMDMDIVGILKYWPTVWRTSQKKLIKMFDFEPTNAVFEKGSYVFGRCYGQLHWPAKVTKVEREKDEYSVKFINDRSTAVLSGDCVIDFNDHTILKVMDEYKKHDQPTDKVFQAVKACKKEIEGLKKKLEKQELANIKKEAKKKAIEEAKPVENSESTRTRNKEKKGSKGLKKLSNVKLQSPPANQSKDESDLANQYTLEGHGKECKETSNTSAEVKREDQSKTNQVAPVSVSEVKMEAVLKETEKIEDTNPIGAQSNIEPACLFSTASDQDQSHEPLIISEPIAQEQLSSAAELAQIQNSEEASEPKRALNAMQVESEPEFQIIEAEEKESKDVEAICTYLGKMGNYLTGKAGAGPLSKDEKMELAILLENHRKFYYQPVMLEAMVSFLKSFDFKLKEERKHCIIEYVKVKERVETACFLRTCLSYDQQTLQILDRYTAKLNLLS